MNIKDIKTQKQFYEFADVWYQRVHKLRAVWQDESKPIAQRGKAYALFQIMVSRVLKLHSIAIKLSQPIQKK